MSFHFFWGRSGSTTAAILRQVIARNACQGQEEQVSILIFRKSTWRLKIHGTFSVAIPFRRLELISDGYGTTADRAREAMKDWIYSYSMYTTHIKLPRSPFSKADPRGYRHVVGSSGTRPLLLSFPVPHDPMVLQGLPEKNGDCRAWGTLDGTIKSTLHYQPRPTSKPHPRSA